VSLTIESRIFSVAPTHRRKQDNKEYVNCTQFSNNKFTNIGSTAYSHTRKLIDINPLYYASALSNQNMNSRFSICKKLTQSECPHRNSLQLAKSVIINPDAIELLPTV
jgi:hypothetical protein